MKFDNRFRDAILSGRKTTTWMLIDPQPPSTVQSTQDYFDALLFKETVAEVDNIAHPPRFANSVFPYAGEFFMVRDVDPRRVQSITLEEVARDLPDIDPCTISIQNFASVWDEFYPQRPWSSNPWAWEFHFRKTTVTTYLELASALAFTQYRPKMDYNSVGWFVENTFLCTEKAKEFSTHGFNAMRYFGHLWQPGGLGLTEWVCAKTEHELVDILIGEARRLDLI